MAYEKSTVPASGTSEYDQKKEPETSIYNIDNKQLKEEVLKKIKITVLLSGFCLPADYSSKRNINRKNKTDMFTKEPSLSSRNF